MSTFLKTGATLDFTNPFICSGFFERGALHFALVRPVTQEVARSSLVVLAIQIVEGL